MLESVALEKEAQTLEFAISVQGVQERAYQQEKKQKSQDCKG